MSSDFSKEPAAAGAKDEDPKKKELVISGNSYLDWGGGIFRLPENVRYIGKWVFHGCNRLKYLELRHDPLYKGSAADRYCQEPGLQTKYL